MRELSLDEKHRLTLEIMKDIDCFCRKNNIRYTISSGTLLGAVRHGGFIPWDDDADIYMPRPDFDRFVKTYSHPRYHCLYNTRDKDEHFVDAYAKISDSTTLTLFKKLPDKYGVFVDVFPLDSVPVDPTERHRYMHRVMRLHNRLFHRQQKDLNSIRKSYFHSLDWWWKRAFDIVHDGRYDDSPLLAHIIPYTYNAIMEKQDFENLVDIDFEGEKFLAIANPHPYLERLYGKDYMIPKVYAHNHHIFSLEQ